MGRMQGYANSSKPGSVSGLAFVFYGLFGNPMLILIGILSISVPGLRMLMVQHQELLKGLYGTKCHDDQLCTLSPADTVKDALTNYFLVQTRTDCSR
jgi:hypothetical protein